MTEALSSNLDQWLVTPPEEYNLDDRLQFILEHGGEIRHTESGKHMPRRYCADERYVDSCSNMSHSAYQECLNGSVETVGDWSRGYFKNEACALCNGVTLFIKDGVRSTKHCFEPGLPLQVTIVFEPNHRQTTSESTDTQVVERQCPKGLVYDDTFGFCREGVVTTGGY